MKAIIVNQVLDNLYKVSPRPNMIHIHYGDRTFSLNPHEDEEGFNTYEVDWQSGLLTISDGDDGVAWIDCDSIISIEL